MKRWFFWVEDWSKDSDGVPSKGLVFGVRGLGQDSDGVPGEGLVKNDWFLG